MVMRMSGNAHLAKRKPAVGERHKEGNMARTER
jgi:hypothetical protein